MADIIVKCWNPGKSGSKSKSVRSWIAELDAQSQKQIDKLISILRQEARDIGMPYSRHLGQGLHELRDQRQSGPGYRLYYCWDDNVVVILLVGGNKSSQSKDIETAQRRMNGEE